MRLPSLRADLQLSSSAPALDGAPQWTLADPLRGRYFKIGAEAMRLLRHWQLGDPAQVLQAANNEPGQALAGADLESMLRFLSTHDLITAADAQQRSSYASKAAQQRQGLWKGLLHQYLFFRIPLWRPNAFLDRTLFFIPVTQRLITINKIRAIFTCYLHALCVCCGYSRRVRRSSPSLSNL